MKQCEYQSECLTAQNFVVNGVVMIPEEYDISDIELKVTITVTVQEAPNVAIPTVDIVAGNYAENLKVSLMSETEEADVYYTLDGSVSDVEHGMKYTEVIDIAGRHGVTETIVLKAVVVKAGMQDSVVAEYVYVITLPKLDGPKAPKNLVGVATTDVGATDGRIQGITTDMEYSTSPEFAEAIMCTGTEVTELAAGIYYVRIAGKKDTNAGAYTIVVVEEHKHTFAEIWSKDEEIHWHASTCGHGEARDSVNEHVYEDYVYNQDATYSSDGTEIGTCVCGANDTRVKVGSKLVDNVKPDVVINVNGEILDNKGNDISFETINESKVKFAINAQDMESGVNLVEYYVATKRYVFNEVTEPEETTRPEEITEGNEETTVVEESTTMTEEDTSVIETGSSEAVLDVPKTGDSRWTILLLLLFATMGGLLVFIQRSDYMKEK